MPSNQVIYFLAMEASFKKMISKVFKYSILLLAIYLWLQAYSPLVYKSSTFFPDDYRNGDLYHLSYLSQFKEKLPNCSSIQSGKKKQNINLFIIGDSFTEEQRINKNDLIAANYTNIHWSKKTDIQLDTTKKNILILETVERTFKEHFSHEVDNYNLGGNNQDITEEKPWRSSLKEEINHAISFIFPKSESIEQRFEASLFSYDFFLKIRELKANMNNIFFGRIEKKVILSKDKENIFFSEEASLTDSHSAFYPFDDKEKAVLVNNINTARKKYLTKGFDEVYLSIIPNKVSILAQDLGNYNHLIERVQSDSNLATPIIDTYTEFRQNPAIYYLKSDSHWTCEGRDLWLKKVNKILATP